MLVKKQGPDGPYWLRKKYDAKMFTAPQRELDQIAGWRDRMSFADLLEERGGPFLGAYQQVGGLERDGKSWQRFCAFTYEYCFDVEVKKDGWMGDIVPVPPEEAWKLALERDKTNTSKVVLEE